MDNWVRPSLKQKLITDFHSCWCRNIEYSDHYLVWMEFGSYFALHRVFSNAIPTNMLFPLLKSYNYHKDLQDEVTRDQWLVMYGERVGYWKSGNRSLTDWQKCDERNKFCMCV